MEKDLKEGRRSQEQGWGRNDPPSECSKDKRSECKQNTEHTREGVKPGVCKSSWAMHGTNLMSSLKETESPDHEGMAGARLHSCCV